MGELSTTQLEAAATELVRNIPAPRPRPHPLSVIVVRQYERDLAYELRGIHRALARGAKPGGPSVRKRAARMRLLAARIGKEQAVESALARLRPAS